ncbi:MAG: ATPase [Geobacter sp.]|nr:MAG: ATPase [Geobacter sp.]
MYQLGLRMIEEGIITKAQLDVAIERQHRMGGRLGQNLVALGFVAEEVLKHEFIRTPRAPQTVEEAQLDPSLVTDLVLKHLLFMGEFKMADISERVKLPVSIIEGALEELRRDKFIEVKGSSSYTKMAYVFKITEAGIKRGTDLLELCRYAGPAPVSLEDYRATVEFQTVKSTTIDESRLKKALSHLVLNENILHRLGPAISSGQAIFIYGPSGNGKSAIAESIGKVFPDTIYVPYALTVGGQIIRIYDPVNHEQVEPADSQEGVDQRWVLIKRPIVITGGELTLNMLDLEFNPISKYYEASLQMKANNGLFIIDDFGRQQAEPARILNRWIVPLDRQIDYVTLSTGMKFAIPFDMVVVFATNLDPQDLVDEAFQRRIRYKVKIGQPNDGEFLEIFKMVCKANGLTFNQEVYDYLLNDLYARDGRARNACHPRDLIEQIIVDSHYYGKSPQLTKENMERSCDNYFISHETA